MNRPDPVGWPWLRTPEATRLLQRLWPESEEEKNDDEEVLTRVHPMDRVTDSPTAASNEVE